MSPSSSKMRNWRHSWRGPSASMADLSPTEEQLRRLKNTVTRAGSRLSQLAQSGELHASASTELASITRDLNEAAGRFERLLAALQQDRQGAGPDGTKHGAGGDDGNDQTGRGGGEEWDDDEWAGVVAGGQVECGRQRPEPRKGGGEPRPFGSGLQIALMGAEFERQPLRPVRAEGPGRRQGRPTRRIEQGKQAEAPTKQIHV